MIIVLWFDLVSSVLVFKIASIIGINFFMKTSKPNYHLNTLQHFPIFFSLLWRSDPLNHKFFKNLSSESEIPK